MAKVGNKTVQRCPECGGKMRLGSRKEVLEYKGSHSTIQTRGLWCEDCPEGILEASALKKTEAAWVELKAAVDGLLTPSQVATHRKQLRLSQRKAGEILGGGPRAFQKYESGQVMVSAAMSHLLTLLANEPSRMSELVESRTPAIQEK
jgi:HTH-type transcriptional regulator / antitoxin MqsA